MKRDYRVYLQDILECIARRKRIPLMSEKLFTFFVKTDYDYVWIVR